MAFVKCRTCRSVFYAKPSHIKYGWGKFCSAVCQYKSYLKGKFLNCEICGKKTWKTPLSIKRSKSGKFFCSKSCQTLWRNRLFVGSRHPNWKHGRDVEYRSILLRSGIKQACKICGIKDKRVLAAHHIDKNSKNNDIKNLVWVCHNCHFLIHNHRVKIT